MFVMMQAGSASHQAQLHLIAVQDPACIQALKSLSKSDRQDPYNLVQQALWPQTPFVNAAAGATEEVPDDNDCPGSWTASTASRGPAGLPQNGYMAHTMRLGQVLRPVPVLSAGLFKASVLSEAMYTAWPVCCYACG